LNLQGIEYIQKIQNLIRVPLGRNCARPSCTTRARPTWPQPAQRVAAALHGDPTAAPHRRTEDGRGNGWLTGAGTAARHEGDGRAVRQHGDGRASVASDRGGRDGGSVGTASDERCRGGGARGEACGGGREGLSGGGRGTVGTAFMPPCARPDSAAHGSQSRLGAARHCH
jgi:hypothetical protein